MNAILIQSHYFIRLSFCTSRNVVEIHELADGKRGDPLHLVSVAAKIGDSTK